MDNKAFAVELEARTRRFATHVIKLSAKLPDSPEGRVIRNQITKAGTSIGANYREANRARSRSDFINRIKICESEASETCYWIEIIDSMAWMPEGVMKDARDESIQLLKLFASIGKNYK
jgi:four helix bundle protein